MGTMKSSMQEISYETLLVSSAQGNKRILFVDDEELIAHMGSRLLEYHGYRVTYKTDSTEALEHFLYKPQRYDLVITDHTMPHIKGTELSKELLKIRPDIPIILCTAGINITPQEAKKIGIREFIPKPFDSDRLVRTIRSMLAETEAKSANQPYRQTDGLWSAG
jgi:DNA-binding NtrC family response regulator